MSVPLTMHRQPCPGPLIFNHVYSATVKTFDQAFLIVAAGKIEACQQPSLSRSGRKGLFADFPSILP